MVDDFLRISRRSHTSTHARVQNISAPAQSRPVHVHVGAESSFGVYAGAKSRPVVVVIIVMTVYPEES